MDPNNLGQNNQTPPTTVTPPQPVAPAPIAGPTSAPEPAIAPPSLIPTQPIITAPSTEPVPSSESAIPSTNIPLDPSNIYTDPAGPVVAQQPTQATSDKKKEYLLIVIIGFIVFTLIVLTIVFSLKKNGTPLFRRIGGNNTATSAELQGASDPYQLIQSYYDYSRGDNWEKFQTIFYPAYRDNLYGFTLLSNDFMNEKTSGLYLTKEDIRFGAYLLGGEPTQSISYPQSREKEYPITYDDKTTSKEIECAAATASSGKEVTWCEIPLFKKSLRALNGYGEGSFHAGYNSISLLKDNRGWWLVPQESTTSAYEVDNDNKKTDFFPLNGMGNKIELPKRNNTSTWTQKITGTNSFKGGSPNYILNLITKNIAASSDKFYQIVKPYFVRGYVDEYENEYYDEKYEKLAVSMHFQLFMPSTKRMEISSSTTTAFKTENGDTYYWVGIRPFDAKNKLIMTNMGYMFLKDTTGKWSLTQIGAVTSARETSTIKGSFISSDYPQD